MTWVFLLLIVIGLIFYFNREKLSKWWDGKKFEYAIKFIFLDVAVLSFSDTWELYSTVGFGKPSHLLGKLGLGWIDRSFLGALAAESAFTVGLWGLFEASKEQGGGLPNPMKYWPTWLLFLGGTFIVGWSNVSGSNGFDYWFGHTAKGLILGLSIPFFLLGSVLVGFSRTKVQVVADQSTGRNEEIDRNVVIDQKQSIDRNWTTGRNEIDHSKADGGRNEAINRTATIEQSTAGRLQEIDQPTATAYTVDNLRQEATDHPLDDEQSTNQPAQANDKEANDRTAEVVEMDDKQVIDQSTEVDDKTESTDRNEVDGKAIDHNVNDKESDHIMDDTEADDKETDDAGKEQHDHQPVVDNVISFKDKLMQSKINAKLEGSKKKTEIARAINHAITYRQQHGGLPSKRTLMKLAKCTGHQALKALDIIKEVSEEMSQTG